MEPTKKAPEIEDLLNTLAGRNNAIRSNTCVRVPIGCGKPIGEFRDAISEREYTISGLCQECQDRVFGMGDDNAD